MRKIALLAVVAFAAACGSSSSTDAGTGFLRVANFASDIPAADFCIKATGTSTWTAGVLQAAGGTSGLVYDGGITVLGTKQVSRYFAYTAGSYDIAVYRLNLPGSTCATPMASLTGVSLGSGVSKLVTIVGIGNTAGLPTSHQLVALTDETSVGAGNVAIRFANMGVASIPGGYTVVPPIDLGVVIPGGNPAIFVNTAYPGVAPARTTPYPVDANGYATMPAASFTAATTLFICPTGYTPTTAPAYCSTFSVSAVTITSGTLASVYIIGVAGTPPNAIFCGDSTAPPVLGYNYSMCTTAIP